MSKKQHVVIAFVKVSILAENPGDAATRVAGELNLALSKSPGYQRSTINIQSYETDPARASRS